MGFIDNLINLIPGVTREKPNQKGPVVAGTFPSWEVVTPQYPTPTPYNSMRLGYKLNEIVYSCVNLRSTAIGEAPLKVYNITGETPEEDKQSALIKLLKRPNDRITQAMFWQVTELYLLVAGFCAWEKERNRLGEVIRLWPMRPDWCGFMRGQNRMLDYIRYQPYGLPPVDVPIDDVVLFQYWDPMYPGLKGWSPTMQAYSIMGVDNNTTAFLDRFFKSGAVPAGLLKTASTLTETEARRIQSLWESQHGGAQNWAKTAVLGSGVEWQSTTMTFKDIGFGDVDARSESRICGMFRVPPIMISAKIGMDRSTYSNYQEAKKGFYENSVMNEWGFLSGMVAEQLLPDFYADPENYTTEFDSGNIKALQEDRNAQWQRATQAAIASLITRDEAREEMGLDPIDETDVFVGNAAPAVGEETEPAEDVPPQLAGFMGAPVTSGSASEQPEQDEEPEKPPTPEEELEEKRYREFVARRKKEGKTAEIARFQFKHIKGARLSRLLVEAGATPNPFRPYFESLTSGSPAAAV